jgi:hypothetical protein
MHPKIEMVSLLELFGLAPLPKLLLGWSRSYAKQTLSFPRLLPSYFTLLLPLSPNKMDIAHFDESTNLK